MKTFSCPFQLGQICTYTYRIAHLKDPMYRLTWNNRKLDGILLNLRKKELSRNMKKKRKLKLSLRYMISQLNFFTLRYLIRSFQNTMFRMFPSDASGYVGEPGNVSLGWSSEVNALRWGWTFKRLGQLCTSSSCSDRGWWHNQHLR